MSNLLSRIRLFLIKMLSTRKVVALQLEGMTVLKDSDITYTGINYHALPNRMFASVSVHYANGKIDHPNFDDLGQAQRNFDFVTKMFIEQQKAKGAHNEQRKVR